MRSGPHIGVCFSLLLLLAPGVQASIPEFFHDLYLESEEAYALIHAQRYARFCHVHDLDPADEGNRRTFHVVRFMHELLTGNGCADGQRGGWLQIPYFWHWIEPNPRHEILALPDSVLLARMTPPAPYQRYRTRADIDRVPALYLCDLVSAQPRYAHLRYGSFYSFGWCSEREMAFVVLMRALGYEGKVWQSHIHTCSKLWCPMRHREGRTIILEAKVDNTFDQIHWDEVHPDAQFAAWREEIGRGSEIAWYNRVARSSEQLRLVRSCEVPAAAAARIRSLVRAGLVQAQADRHE